MKIKKKYLPIWICSILAVGILMGSLFNFSPYGKSKFPKHQTNKIFQLIDLIDREYVDSISTDSIMDLTITDLLSKLDPHSVYIPESEMEQVSQQMKGDFVGIGINFYVIKDSLAVIKTTPNGPSEKAGILSGDRILFADNKKLFGKKIPLDSLFAALKGKEGSEVALTIYRKTENKTFKIKLKRDKIALNSVDVSVRINDTLGYIKINRFAESTYREFESGLAALKKQGIKSLIIDVRDNGGGYLDQAVKIADDLLPDQQLIVFTKNKKGRIDKTFATQKGSFEQGNVFVLINENSASASEVLAGAVQDNDRGIIVGRRSFGKGLVQREVKFEDRSAVRLTVARYYTPTGRSIQRSYKNGSEEYFNEFGHRFETGELYKKDSIKIADTLKFKTPKGKIVYGGGGIVPDIFVPFETEHGQEGIVYIMKSAIVGNFVFKQLDQNRKEFLMLDKKGLASKINDSDYYFDAFCKLLMEDGFVKNSKNFKLENNKSLVKTYIWAEFSNQLFGEETAYEILLQQDAMIQTLIK